MHYPASGGANTIIDTSTVKEFLITFASAINTGRVDADSSVHTWWPRAAGYFNTVSSEIKMQDGFLKPTRGFATRAVRGGREAPPDGAVVLPLVTSATFRQATPAELGMVWIETPSNPTMKVVDIAEIVDLVKSERSDALVAVDNTFLTSYFQKPLDFGADISVYSLTKHMNGHTDVIMGAAVVNDTELEKKLRRLQNDMGAIPSPFDCYLVNRSLKTLALRMEQHKKSSLTIARWLEKHPNVVEVLHPGLTSHPQHEIAKNQTAGNSGVFSFRLSGGLAESKRFLSSLKLFILAVSFGGCESSVELPSLMTHESVPAELKARLGITDSLVRISVGLEDTDDLLEDLDQALDATYKYK